MISMKRLLSALVLVFSLSAAGVYVWKFSQKNAPTPTPPEVVKDNETLPPLMAENAAEPSIIVTDEEVRATRERMLSSSKSGLVMSEEDVRKMLEKRKKEEMKGAENPLQKLAPEAEDLVPSTKSPGRAITPEGLRRGVDAIQRKPLR
jgi:hypothetical protein